MQNNSKLLVQLNQSELETLLGDIVKRELSKALQPTAPTPKANLLTRKQTAKLLGISLPTLSDYTNKGKLRSYRLGGSIRYKESEVLASLEILP
jgi:excisionase family DNA binding protein